MTPSLSSWFSGVDDCAVRSFSHGKSNQTLQRAGGNNNRVLLAIDCFYCNCFLPAFMALFINRVHAFSAQGWKIAAVALLLSIFLAWLTQGWWFWPLGPVILTG